MSRNPLAITYHLLPITFCDATLFAFFGGNSRIREELLSPFLVPQNSRVMFHQTCGEMMGPIFFGDKVQIGSRDWIEHSLDGFSPGIANGTGGQTSPCVGVIGSVGLEVGFSEVAVEIL
jgi:hypothetical protein